MAVEEVLPVAKDTFMRSNRQNRNSGASELLYVAHRSTVRTLISFDLSGVSNKIEQAELRIVMGPSEAKKPITLVVAPMVSTANNANWGEGRGTLGALGAVAMEGEACYLRSAYPAVSWEDASERALRSLGEGKLWGAPIATLSGVKWESGKTLIIAIPSALPEAARKGNPAIVTFGLWGTGGNGQYAIFSKESGSPPELVLTEKAGDKK